MKCQCEQCTDTPALTYTEAHRLRCEALFVCSIRSKDARIKYIDKITEKRGGVAAKKLHDEVVKQWGKRQQ